MEVKYYEKSNIICAYFNNNNFCGGVGVHSSVNAAFAKGYIINPYRELQLAVIYDFFFQKHTLLSHIVQLSGNIRLEMSKKLTII